MLPFSEACERNKAPILSVLESVFQDIQSVLEIGSGTGQHAVYFAEQLPSLVWHPSDFGEYFPGLQARVAQSALPNLKPPIELDVRNALTLSERYQGIFSANTLHIMSASSVQCFFERVGELLQENGKLVIYGPFNYSGKYSSESNAEFDIWLKQRDPESAIRDLGWLRELAAEQSIELIEDLPMPANNQCLVWQKKPA